MPVPDVREPLDGRRHVGKLMKLRPCQRPPAIKILDRESFLLRAKGWAVDNSKSVAGTNLLFLIFPVLVTNGDGELYIAIERLGFGF